MAEFAEILENIRAEEATAAKLFEGEGTRVRGAKNPKYMALLSEAAQLVADVYSGRRPMHVLKEAMATADFPYLFGDILDRQLLAAYRETPTTLDQWCRVSTVPDFRTVNRFYTDGADNSFTSVGELGEYPMVTRSEGKYTYAVKKYGAAFELSWEALINDDLDALKDQPARFGRAARRTEEKFATGLVCEAAGPNASFYTTGQGNRLSSNPVFSSASLQTAIMAASLMTDAGGEPILNTMTILMVGPGLEVTARNVLNAMEIRLKDAGGTSNEELLIRNWFSALKLVVNPWLPIISTSNDHTQWYMFADPNEGRGAVEIGKLRGHTEPEVFMKTPDATRVGGGADAFAGSFDADSIRYKVRHVIGGTRLDYRYSIASNGSGS